MSRLCLIIVASLGLWSASALGSGPPPPRELTCDATFGPAIASTDLVRRFGSANVSTEDIEGGGAEGDTEPATVLFAKDPADRVEIHWKDKTLRRSPRFVGIHGTRSRWRTRLGLTLGIDLRRLERLNQRPFRLAGFGFDGEGAVLSWAGGALEKSDTKNCWIFVRMAAEWPADADGQRTYRQVEGDKNFSSAHPAMRVLDPTIREITLIYGPRGPANTALHPTAAGSDAARPRVSASR